LIQTGSRLGDTSVGQR